MAVFKAFHPDNQTIGGAILAIIEAIGYYGVDNILAQHGLKVIEPDGWYSQQAELDMMQAILERGSGVDLIAVGMKIPDKVEYPVPIRTVEEALTMLNAGYQHNHRGKEIGYFSSAKIRHNYIRLKAHTPYPSDLEYGILYKLGKKYRPVDASGAFSVIHLDQPTNRKNGGDTCYYDVIW